MSKRRDPHEVLGVSQRASQAEIRDAYRRLARQSHPDLHRDGLSDEMAEINEAYRVLTATTTPTATFDERNHPTGPRATDDQMVAARVRPVAFPWRGIIAASVVGASAIVGLSLFAGPEADSPPDGVIQSGSCVRINDSLLAVEVPCDDPDHRVVSQLVPLDARCADGSNGFLDRLGMGRACLE